jgi:WD40 repeat protein
LAKPVASITCGEHDVTRFVVKDDLLVSGSKNQVSAWNIKDKSYCKINTFVGHTKSVYCVETLGEVVLSGSRDRSIKVKTKLGLLKHILTFNKKLFSFQWKK